MIRILPGEDPEEYERVKNGWNAEYEPEGHMEETLANNLIESEWLLLRARRNRFNAEARAVGEGKEPHEWTAEDNHQVELMQRYLTTAERSFYRAFNAMQGLRKDIMREKKNLFQMERLVHKIETERDVANARIQELERNQQPAAQASSAKASGVKASSSKTSGATASGEKAQKTNKKQGKIQMIDAKTVTMCGPGDR